MSESQREASHHPDEPRSGDDLQPLAVSSVTIVRWGLIAWAVALLVTVAVPALHQGDRSWWPWTCVGGIAVGALGYAYIHRGRGNASGAA